jgi:hypothetical protein
MKKKLLLHVCCAPCLIGTLPFFGPDDFDVSCFWYNPNIQPFDEYEKRLNALIGYACENNIALTVKNSNEFDPAGSGDRCVYCYETRLKETAGYAGENGFDIFTTTLLVSPYQNHEKIKEAGGKYSDISGAAFYGGDFRENFRAGQKIARGKNLYMQKYCGCIFGENI